MLTLPYYYTTTTTIIYKSCTKNSISPLSLQLTSSLLIRKIQCAATIDDWKAIKKDPINPWFIWQPIISLFLGLDEPHSIAEQDCLAHIFFSVFSAHRCALILYSWEWKRKGENSSCMWWRCCSGRKKEAKCCAALLLCTPASGDGFYLLLHTQREECSHTD